MRLVKGQIWANLSVKEEKVWNVLGNDTTYRQWTSPFGQGSYAETDWEEGSKVRFLGSDGSGMVSNIKKKRTFGGIIVH